jgi:hypothetical protein
MTVPQYEKACMIAHRHNLGDTVTVHPVFMMKDAIGMECAGMFIAVLPDGSSHS